MIGEELDLIEDRSVAAEYPTTELPPAEDPLHGKGPAMTPPEDRPVRIRITPQGIKLAFFHGSRSMPPFKLTIPYAQWAQMAQLITYPPPGVQGFEAFVGFTPEALALHQIDAVEAGGGEGRMTNA
ncbi:MAG: hypothetical protein P4L99_20875 [Chthoniobacter sp.]|nr:hypothetical protein [Chthoniobacter sp.]